MAFRASGDVADDLFGVTTVIQKGDGSSPHDGSTEDVRML